jgi:hypothetical protein
MILTGDAVQDAGLFLPKDDHCNLVCNTLGKDGLMPRRSYISFRHLRQSIQTLILVFFNEFLVLQDMFFFSLLHGPGCTTA